MSSDGPDAIVPDTKNWTWVLERPCPQCGLDTRAVEPIGIAGRLEAVAADFAAVLRGGDVRDRPPAVAVPPGVPDGAIGGSGGGTIMAR